MDLFPKRGGQTFNSEYHEVSLMQHTVGARKLNLAGVWNTLDYHVSADVSIICHFSSSHCAVGVYLGCHVFFIHVGVCHVGTSLQDLLDLDVVGTEAAVELEVVSVVEEGTPKRK